MRSRVAVDIGGTFTDLVAEDEHGALTTTKVLSTPSNLVAGVLGALDASGVDIAAIDVFVHGTTQGLNALLERRGARVALVTTAGFRDTYLLGRCHRPDMYNLRYRKPEPLLDRAAIFEVSERIGADGSELLPVDAASVTSVASSVRTGHFDAVAVCLVHGYLHIQHEQMVVRLLEQELPGVAIVASHQVAPEWREYERSSTTVMSAYITPVMRAYLDQLETALRDSGLSVPVFINESNGGVMTAHLAADHAIGTLLSGPVGGVTGTAALVDLLGEGDLIAADVGGTSFDVSIIRDGRPTVRSEFEMQGLPVLSPSIEVHTLGAGGGSYITVDDVGRLRVGPQSAGAEPGPVCYGRGGTTPTVTDAHAVLGNIPVVQRLAGRLSLDVELARRAMGELGARLGLDAVELAHQALEIVNFRMAEAIRELTTERGLDPRTFVLCCFGGAGGLHAAAIADELEVARVVIPHLPGSFSAAGMLHGGIQHDLVQAFFRDQRGAERDLDIAVDALRQRGLDMLRAENVPLDEAYVRFFVDVRYAGQEFSMTVPLREGAPFHVLIDDFQTLYHGRYGHSSPGSGIEVVAVRTRVGRHFEQHSSQDEPPTSGGPTENQLVHFADGSRLSPVHHREHVLELGGPALIIESTSTTLLPPHWRAERLVGGHLLLHRNGAS